jgi:phage terminase large subunit-like protein
MVGIFAPVDDQADIVFSRIVTRLTSERAVQMLLDPEIDEKVDGKSKVIRLKGGSFCRRQTANPRAKIEGASYHIILIDECQDADEGVIRKSIHPMLAFYAGTIVKIGTPGYHKGDFWKARVRLQGRQPLQQRLRPVGDQREAAHR